MVIREDRNTTKVRVVCDASANNNGPSLSKSLETGPCLLPETFDVFIRFRAYKYGLTSDFKAAFLNIRIAEKDRDFLRFLWVSNIEENEPEVIVKCFTSVVFGLNYLPFLFGATIKYDILLKKGGFNLRKWITNSFKIPNKIDEYESKYFGESPSEKREIYKLGVSWKIDCDKFLFNLKEIMEVITKRVVLKVISCIFDPLGILSPIVSNLKLLFQELCYMKIDWDVSLAIEIDNKWKKVLFESSQTDIICLSRHYLPGFDLNKIREIQLHGFSDTSFKGYAAVICLRFTLIDGSIFTSLVSLKMKVILIKK